MQKDGSRWRPVARSAAWISFSGTLLPFSVCSRRPGMRAQTVLFKAWVTSRSLTPAEPPVLSEASCPQTRGLYQPLPASSRMACLWPRHSDSPAFGQRGHPGGVTRLFRAGGLQRLGGSRRALGADCTEEGAPGALGAPSTPWTGRSGVASYRPCRQPPGVMRFSPAPSSS